MQDVIKLNDPGDKEFVASRDVNNFIHLQARDKERGRYIETWKKSAPFL